MKNRITELRYWMMDALPYVIPTALLAATSYFYVVSFVEYGDWELAWLLLPAAGLMLGWLQWTTILSKMRLRNVAHWLFAGYGTVFIARLLANAFREPQRWTYVVVALVVLFGFGLITRTMSTKTGRQHETQDE